MTGLHKKIGTFGDVAAEQDTSMLSYFLRTDAVNKIASGNTVVVIGRKGSGKTALAKYFSEPGQGYISESLSLRDYPWSIHQKRRNLGASEIESYVSSWRYLMAVRTIVLLLEHGGRKIVFDSQKSAYQFLTDNYGGINPSLQDILRPKKLRLTKGSFRPSVMGNAIGEVGFDTDTGSIEPEIDALTDSIVECALTMMSQLGVSKVLLHFDELDQGLSAVDEQYEMMLVGLVLASRLYRSSNRDEQGIFPVAYLRTDIWDEFRFSDKNKISQSSAVLLEWDTDTLKSLINERIRVKIGSQYSWDDLDDGYLMRGSQSKWSHIISRTFLRPRDVIQFLNCALSISLGRNEESDVFDNEDIQLAREPYSRYLKQELDDELGPHWDKWAEALQACSEISTITFSRDVFVEAYERRKSKKNFVDSDDALELLYQFSVVGYRRGIGKGGSGWVFQYSDPHAGYDNGASLLKVHLGLKEYAKLREERS